MDAVDFLEIANRYHERGFRFDTLRAWRIYRDSQQCGRGWEGIKGSCKRSKPDAVLPKSEQWFKGQTVQSAEARDKLSGFMEQMHELLEPDDDDYTLPTPYQINAQYAEIKANLGYKPGSQSYTYQYRQSLKPQPDEYDNDREYAKDLKEFEQGKAEMLQMQVEEAEFEQNFEKTYRRYQAVFARQREREENAVLEEALNEADLSGIDTAITTVESQLKGRRALRVIEKLKAQI